MKKIIRTILLIVAITGSIKNHLSAQAMTMKTQKINYNYVNAGGLKVFYREAGPKDAPVVLLLHGYPTSSAMFRNLVPVLADKYHVIAPDMPGFGLTEAPDRSSYNYTFDHLAQTMQAFIESLALKRFAVYIFDYGAPVGLRLALANPEKITGIISQNGNAYVEGLSAGWNPIQKYWKEPTEQNRQALRSFTTPDAIKWQYEDGVNDKSLIAPESYLLDSHFMERPGQIDIQLDLFKDYQSNVALYPKFQEYFRNHKPKLLAVWGNKDPFFLPAGAEAYRRDIPNAIVKFYDTGHFALETHLHEIGNDILAFLAGLPK